MAHLLATLSYTVEKLLALARRIALRIRRIRRNIGIVWRRPEVACRGGHVAKRGGRVRDGVTNESAPVCVMHRSRVRSATQKS